MSRGRASSFEMMSVDGSSRGSSRGGGGGAAASHAAGYGIRLAVMAALVVAGCAVLSVQGAGPAHAQIQFGGFGDSPFERDFGDVKFLDAYFGKFEEKIEVEAGDSNVPFTVVFANIGTQDITGIRGQLSLPFGFEASGGSGNLLVRADSDSNSMAGEVFSLTFFVDVGDNIEIGQYPAAVKVDYSRLRESGVRTAYADFDFSITGDTVVNIKAVDPFLTSLRSNEVVIQISNDGTAPLAGVEVVATNTQTESASAESTTNVENVILFESSWDLGQIEPKSSVTITTTVYVPHSLRGETLRIPVEVSYYNPHGDQVAVSRIVDFYVKGLIDLAVFDVGVIEISDKPMIIGEIINEGNEDGLFGFVSITPVGDSNIKPSSQFLDELEVDAPVPFNVLVEFADGEPRYGEHEIRIDVRYKDSVRDEHLLTHYATVYIPEPPPPEPGPFDVDSDAFAAFGAGGDLALSPVMMIIVAAAAVVIAVIVVAAARRRRSDE